MTAKMDFARTRTLPSPLNLSSSLHSTTSPPPLLYDLPQASSITPTARPPRPSPRSPPPRNRSRGPMSPTTPPFGPTLSHPRPVYAGRDIPGSPPRATKHTPPPSRPLSASAPLELEAFAAHCRAWSVSRALPFSAHSLILVILSQVFSTRCCCRRSHGLYPPEDPLQLPGPVLPSPGPNQVILPHCARSPQSFGIPRPYLLHPPRAVSHPRSPR